MAASMATAKGLNGIEAGAKKLAKPKLGDVGTDGGAVLNDADVGLAVEGGSKSILSYEDAEEIAFDSIAKAMDAQYFNLENWNELSSQYSGEEIWKINEKFLDIQTSSGREIYLSHNPMDYVGDGSYYSKEVQYLMDNGYRFIKEGEVWHAIR